MSCNPIYPLFHDYFNSVLARIFPRMIARHDLHEGHVTRIYYLVITPLSLPALASLARNWRSPRNYFNFSIFSPAREQSAIHELRVHTVAALFRES